MKTIKYIAFLLLSILITLPSFAQIWKNGTFEHKIVAGFNIGATTPLSIPAEVRSVEAWWPQFTPQLGYNVVYRTESKWGLGSGILLNYKGMGIRDRVKYMYTEVIPQEGSNSILKGYFVGKNETTVKTAYVTIPLYATYKASENWEMRLGGYASYLFSGQFKGHVSDGYIRLGDPTGEKVEITEKATFDFNDDLRSFDFGLTVGAERRINDRFGVYGNLDWGLRPIFPSDFRAVEFNMYNIYFTFGLTYKL
ncbi:porin family protein [Dysgonomonas sp. ZJ279]|uniref:porin family protein n=1 Tax=Dysgonomonas sp. ZJ279 TaxID=2709796 RepID=UPI0013EA8F1B|nr:porin family protein [Dysgonomonas sp. ZJ279]